MEKIIIPVLVVLAFGIAVLLAFIGVKFGCRNIPLPPEHLRDRKKNGVPRMRNPAPPPLISAESMRLSIENHKKAEIAFEKMKNQLKEARK